MMKNKISIMYQAGKFFKYNEMVRKTRGCWTFGVCSFWVRLFRLNLEVDRFANHVLDSWTLADVDILQCESCHSRLMFRVPSSASASVCESLVSVNHSTTF